MTKESHHEGGPDMEHRDPKDLNHHVKVHFDEVFGEPHGVRSIDGVWKCSYKCFNCTLNCCYKTLSVLCGCPLAFCWACEFACLAFSHIWLYTPMIRYYTINLTWVRRILTLFCEAYYGPCCETLGLCLSKIAVHNHSGNPAGHSK